MKILRFGSPPLPYVYVLLCSEHENEVDRKKTNTCQDCSTLYSDKNLSDEKSLEMFRKYEKS